MKRVYLSGPMSAFADSNYNYDAFHKAAAAWRAKGFEVDNPAEHFNGEQGLSKSTYMRSDIQAVLNTEAVIVLPGWEDSEGACLEVAIAHALALPVFDATRPGEYVAVSGKPTYRVFSPEDAARAITEGHKPQKDYTEGIAFLRAAREKWEADGKPTVKPGDPGLYGLPTVDHPDPIAANPDYGDCFAPPRRSFQPFTPRDEPIDPGFYGRYPDLGAGGPTGVLDPTKVKAVRKSELTVEEAFEQLFDKYAYEKRTGQPIEDSSPREFVNKVFREPVFTKQAVEDFAGQVDGGGYKASMDDQTKLLLDLIPPAFIRATGQVLTHGAHKYAPNNWMRGMSWSHVYGALLRHMLAWHEGEDTDPASGLPHLAHAACNLAFLTHFALSGDERYRQFDDRIFAGVRQ